MIILNYYVSILLLNSILIIKDSNGFMHSKKKLELKELTRDLWNHGYNNYKQHAFPEDELLPLTCKGQSHDRKNPHNLGINDVMGDYALTLVDSLDSWAIFNDKLGFENAVRETIQYVNFNVDSRVQVFEVVIRMMGGLLSAHILAIDPIRGFKIPWYNNELLHLARDLGQRLLPAFNTQTGIPYARVHLQKGVIKGEGIDTCTAGAGSLILEFGTLSQLTGDKIYYEKARKAFFAIWNRRSDLDLVGNSITLDGNWISLVAGTGAGIDSFYEYAAKAYVFFGEDEWYRVWNISYAAVMKHIRGPDKFWYRGANMKTGQLASVVVDSLGAFFPGTQALMGDVESAIKAHAVYAFQWKRYGGLPETFDINRRQAVNYGYPLRPEMIESNLYLYQATKDEFYLELAEEVLRDLRNKTMVPCGLATILDLQTGELKDEQPSFAISETLKYLYLTFDESNQFNRDDSNMVFTTEGHMLQIDSKPIKGRRRRTSTSKTPPICPLYDPESLNLHQNPLARGIGIRKDLEYARFAAGYVPKDEQEEIRKGRWSTDGFCLIPVMEEYTVDLLFASPNDIEDLTPDTTKVEQNPDGSILIHKIAGLRFSLTRAAGGEAGGFLISKVGPFKVPTGKFVSVRDPVVLMTIKKEPLDNHLLHIRISSEGEPIHLAVVVEGLAASFGPSLDPSLNSEFNNLQGYLALNSPSPIGVVVIGDTYGCRAPLPGELEDPSTGISRMKGKILIVRRGMCPFVVKSSWAAIGGAKGIIVINTQGQNNGITPSSDEEAEIALGKMVPMILISWEEGQRLLDFLNPRNGEGRVEVSIGKLAIVPLQLGGYTVNNVRLLRDP